MTRELTTEETAALQAFANAFPKGDRKRGCYSWKEVLTNIYWYNARVWEDDNGSKDHGYVLHSIRNSLGHPWLFSANCKIKPIKS